jgi:hypothetical protein
MSRCKLEANDISIEITLNEGPEKLDDWSLGQAIVQSIKAFDSACPSVTGVSSLAKRVSEGLKDK